MRRRYVGPKTPRVEHVDELDVRWRAAQRAFVIAGGVGASRDFSGPDAGWWEQWAIRRAELDRRRDRPALVEHYESALEQLDALEIYDHQQARMRRNLTPRQERAA